MWHHIDHSKTKTFSFIGLLVISAFANSQSVWSISSEVYGYDPSHLDNTNVYSGLGQWASAGYRGSSHALSAGHPFEPPQSQAEASSSFDQSKAEDGVLRGSALLRLGYRVNDTNFWQARARTTLIYDIEVTSNSNSELDIVFGNQLHGVLAQVDYGIAKVTESMTISEIGQTFSSVTLNEHGVITETGKFVGSTHQQDISDPYFNIVHTAFEMNSFNFYGSRHFAPHETHVTNIAHTMSYSAEFSDPNLYSGLAMADFSNTGHLNVKAFDPVTGADRSNEITVAIVSEPVSLLALSFSLVGIISRRTKRTKDIAVAQHKSL